MSDCKHPNLIITEILRGTAVHKWRKGIYDWSDELIERTRIKLECPDCDYSETLVKGEDEISEEIFALLEEARKYSRGNLQ